MSSVNKNLSEFSGEWPDASNYTIGIAVSEWNDTVTNALLTGALDALKQAGIAEERIKILKVPGTFELPVAAKWLAEIGYDAVICLGCVIQGETRHFDFICQAAANGIMQASLESSKPVIFGVLTTDNLQQALDRSGGKYGNKGFEAGVTAVKMLALSDSF